MRKKHIFVSYAHQDKDFARQLSSRLKESGRTPWQDLRIKGGAMWQDAIDNALRNAEALVVVMSPHAARSQYVTYEWAFAVGAKILVIPVLKESAKLHPRLNAIQAIDFTTRRGTPWVNLRNSLPAPPPSSPGKVVPEIRAKFSLVDGKLEKEDGYYLINISVDNAPKGADQVTYEFHDETLKRAKWPSKAAKADFKSSIYSNGDSLLSASIRTRGKEKLRIASSLYDALQRGHGTDPKPPVKQALAKFKPKNKNKQKS